MAAGKPRKKSQKSNETAIAKKIRDALAKAGYTVFRVQAGMKKVDGYWMHFAPAGTPDICGYSPDGKFVGIEVKDLAVASPEQVAFIEKAKAAGCLVGIAHNVEEAFDIVGFKKAA